MSKLFSPTAVVAALAVSVTLNILLTVRASQQRALITDIRRQATPLLGQNVPPFAARAVDGTPITIGYEGDRPTVLYVFAPKCGWCRRNRPLLERLVAEVGPRYRFLALSLSRDGLEEEIATTPLPIPVISDVDALTRLAYQLGGTPQTIVIDPSGKVVENWHGAYQFDQRREIEHYFDIRLPEIDADDVKTE